MVTGIGGHNKQQVVSVTDRVLGAQVSLHVP